MLHAHIFFQGALLLVVFVSAADSGELYRCRLCTNVRASVPANVCGGDFMRSPLACRSISFHLGDIRFVLTKGHEKLCHTLFQCPAETGMSHFGFVLDDAMLTAFGHCGPVTRETWRIGPEACHERISS